MYVSLNSLYKYEAMIRYFFADFDSFEILTATNFGRILVKCFKYFLSNPCESVFNVKNVYDYIRTKTNIAWFRSYVKSISSISG